MPNQWLSGAVRVPGESSGAAVAGSRPSILHHSTEGASASGAIGAYHATRSWPTLTAEWTGVRLAVFQHMPLNMMARALEHPPGTPETNRANVTQIEHVGFTDEAERIRAGADPTLHVSRWPDARWAAIGSLCREIEAITGCRPSTGIPLARWQRPAGWRQGGAEFVVYDEHTAHVFAPNNHHTDGTGFLINLVVDQDDRPWRALTVVPSISGPDVLALQLAVRLRALRCGRADRVPVADGVYGPLTARAAGFVGYVLGIGESPDALVLHGLSPYVQRLIRDPSGRNRTQIKRAAERRPKNCKGA